MGISSDGHISYGYLLNDDAELPWEDDLEGWWRQINSYKSPFEVYNDKGEYIGGKRPDDQVIDDYYQHMRDWEEANPLPVELVNSKSYDYPLYILAVPGTYKSVFRGCPETFEPSELTVDAAKLAALDAFIAAHKLEPVKGPAWFLGSLYG